MSNRLAPYGLLIEPQQGCGWEKIVDCAARAEELGFGSVFMADHYFPTGPTQLECGVVDTWMCLTAVALRVPRVQIGPLMSPVSFRPPLQLSVMARMLDQISGGRASLGVGAGWLASEHAAMGRELAALSLRFDQLEEGLELIQATWATESADDTYAFVGKFASFEAWIGPPKRLGNNEVPIIIGGTGRVRTPRLAARYASEFNVPFVNPQLLRTLFEILHRACLVEGRATPVSRSASIAIYAGDDLDAATERTRRCGESPAEVRNYGGVGTVETLIPVIRQYWKAGCDRLYFQVLDPGDIEHLELLAEVAANSAP